ncbi:MAG: Response regulator receiver protein [Parcubacteria group bacterium GW2011_GWC1_41_7]|nr:MAG: Response regulator receiver protein [Parcubacteria group bacterium GW2011_GWC1_41_7]
MSKVLIVEDDKFLRTLLEKKLRSESFEVVTAADGEEAMNQLVSTNPDMVLLDIILPKISGFSFLEQVQKDPNLNKIPVIILSNLAQGEDVQKGKDLGAIDYFVKANTSLEDLIKKVRAFLQDKAPL